MKHVRVVVVEDHTLVRAGIRSLLEELEGIEVVGEASDGREGLRLVEATRPDLVLMDVAMPGLNGLEAAARIAKELPGIRVLLISMYASEEYVLRALRIGVSGYLVKDAAPRELEFAIKAIAEGETYLSPAVSKIVVKHFVRRGAPGDHADRRTARRFERLTPRQREVLQLIAEGHTTKKIAQLLSLSVKTVETHRTQLMEQLDIHDVTGLVRYAISVGLIRAEL